MLNRSRFKSSSREQGELLPTYPCDLIPESHLSRIIVEVIDTLDLTALYLKYGWEGGEAFHPKAILRVIFYAYSQGTCSSRGISQECRENLIYMFLASGLKPDFRTISEFRRRNLDILKQLFTQIIQICKRLGMINIGNIYLDGTKIKANASKRSIVRKEKVEEELKQIEKQIVQIFTEAETVDTKEDQILGDNQSHNQVPEKLAKAKKRRQELQAILKELDDLNQNKMSLTDKDATFMLAHDRFQLSYNCQCATENQVILAFDVSDKKEDSSQLLPMITELEQLSLQLLGEKEYPLEDVNLVTDAGYDTIKNLDYLEKRKINAYVANQDAKALAKKEKEQVPESRFTKDKFIYHSDGDYYECPAGKKLEYRSKTIKARGNYKYQEILYQGENCNCCPYQCQCIKTKKGNRLITRYPEYDPVRKKIDLKLTTKQGQIMMRKRAQDVEPTFAQIKQNILGGRSFLLRGMSKVTGEFSLVCLVHNVKKIANFLKSPENSAKRSILGHINIKLA